MSLILHYPLNQSDPTVALVGATPTQGTVGNDVTSTTDATYGTVAFFDSSSAYLGTPAPTEITSNNPRTISLWAKRDSLNTSFLFANGSISGSGNLQFELILTNLDPDMITTRHGNSPFVLESNVAGAFAIGKWAHVVVTYDGTTLSNYVDGVLISSKNETLNTSGVDTFTIGLALRSTHLEFIGTMTDFRIYDGALDASTVAQLFADGPNDATAPTINLTPFTHLIDLDWGEVTGASTYHLRYSVDSGVEQDLASTTELSHVFYDVVPGSSYEFKLFTDLDLVTPLFTETVVALSIDNTNITSLLTRLGNDLTLLSQDSVDQFESLLGGILTTGDTVNTSVGSTTFVANSETVTLLEAPKEVVFTPFNQSSGAGQTVAVVLPDTSTVNVSYDETLNQIDVGGTTYEIGESFVSGGLKVTSLDI